MKNLSRYNFNNFLNRMEKKYTLNESQEKNLLLESGPGGIVKYVKEMSEINFGALKNGFKNLLPEDLKPNFNLSNDVENFLRQSNSYIDELAKNLNEINAGRIDINLPSSSVLKSSISGWVDKLVDDLSLSFKEIDELTDVEKQQLKDALNGVAGATIPKKLLISNPKLSIELRAIQMKNSYAIISSMLGDTMHQINMVVKQFPDGNGKQTLSSIILGLLRRDGNMTKDLDTILDDLIELDALINKKYSQADLDAGLIPVGKNVGDSIFPDMVTKWKSYFNEVQDGNIKNVDGVDVSIDLSVLTKEKLKAIFDIEMTRNNLITGVFNTKYRKNIFKYLTFRKINKILPKIKKETGIQLNERDLENAIVVDTGDGIQVFVIRDAKARAKMEELFDLLITKRQKLDEWLDESFGGKDPNLEKLSKSVRNRIRWSIILTLTPPILYLSIWISLIIKCTSLKNKLEYSDEELEAIRKDKGEDYEPNEMVRKGLNCGLNLFNIAANWGLLLVDTVWDSSIENEFILVDNAIEKEIEKRCNEFKEKHNTECCTLNCSDEIGDDFEIEGRDGKKIKVKEKLKQIIDSPAFKKLAETQDMSVLDLIKLLDQSNRISGALTADGQDIDIKAYVENLCKKKVYGNTVNQDCIEKQVKSTLETLNAFECDVCTLESVTKHINDNFDILESMGDIISVNGKDSSDNVDGKVSKVFNITQEHVIDLTNISDCKDLNCVKNKYLSVAKFASNKICKAFKDHAEGNDQKEVETDSSEFTTAKIADGVTMIQTLWDQDENGEMIKNCDFIKKEDGSKMTDIDIVNAFATLFLEMKQKNLLDSSVVDYVEAKKAQKYYTENLLPTLNCQ